MIQREGKEFHSPVLINDLRFLHIKFHIVDFKLHSLTELDHKEIKYRPECLWSIDPQRSASAKKAHSRKQTEEAEDMVTVDMRQADMLYPEEGHAYLAQLDLCTFSTIHHK